LLQIAYNQGKPEVPIKQRGCFSNQVAS